MTTKKCNICGKTFDTLDEVFDFGLHTIIGYGSKRDGDTIILMFARTARTSCSMSLIRGVLSHLL